MSYIKQWIMWTLYQKPIHKNDLHNYYNYKMASNQQQPPVDPLSQAGIDYGKRGTTYTYPSMKPRSKKNLTKQNVDTIGEYVRLMDQPIRNLKSDYTQALFPKWAPQNVQKKVDATNRLINLQTRLKQVDDKEFAALTTLKPSAQLAFIDGQWQGSLIDKLRTKSSRLESNLKQRYSKSAAIFNESYDGAQLEKQLPYFLYQLVSANRQLSQSGIGPISNTSSKMYLGRWFDTASNRVRIFPNVTNKYINPTSLSERRDFLQAKMINCWNSLLQARDSYNRLAKKNEKDYAITATKSLYNQMSYDKSLIAYNKYITNKLSTFQSQFGLGEVSKSYQNIILGAIPIQSQTLIYGLDELYKTPANTTLTEQLKQQMEERASLFQDAVDDATGRIKNSIQKSNQVEALKNQFLAKLYVASNAMTDFIINRQKRGFKNFQKAAILPSQVQSPKDVVNAIENYKTQMQDLNSQFAYRRGYISGITPYDSTLTPMENFEFLDANNFGLMKQADPYVVPKVIRSKDYNVQAFRDFINNNAIATGNVVARKNQQQQQQSSNVPQKAGTTEAMVETIVNTINKESQKNTGNTGNTGYDKSGNQTDVQADLPTDARVRLSINKLKVLYNTYKTSAAKQLGQKTRLLVNNVYKDFSGNEAVFRPMIEAARRYGTSKNFKNTADPLAKALYSNEKQLAAYAGIFQSLLQYPDFLKDVEQIKLRGLLSMSKNDGYMPNAQLLANKQNLEVLRLIFSPYLTTIGQYLSNFDSQQKTVINILSQLLAVKEVQNQSAAETYPQKSRQNPPPPPGIKKETQQLVQKTLKSYLI